MKDLKYNTDEACRRLDHYISEILKNTDINCWHETLDYLEEKIKRENRLFIAADGNMKKRLQEWFK